MSIPLINVIRSVAPLCSNPSEWADALQQSFDANNITSSIEKSYFIGEWAYESQQFTHLSENLYYTNASRLYDIFREHFKDVQEAELYAGNPEKIANRVYANRMGNGDEESGDGWKFRGRGLCQLTGRIRYTDAAKDLNLPLVEQPDLLLSVHGAVAIGMWYWKANNLGIWAIRRNPQEVTRRIVGGLTGIDARIAMIERALKTFSIS